MDIKLMTFNTQHCLNYIEKTIDSPVMAGVVRRFDADIACHECLSYSSPEPIKKIDYIFVSHDIEILSADVPDAVASDHRPHIATVRIV